MHGDPLCTCCYTKPAVEARVAELDGALRELLAAIPAGYSSWSRAKAAVSRAIDVLDREDAPKGQNLD